MKNSSIRTKMLTGIIVISLLLISIASVFILSKIAAIEETVIRNKMDYLHTFLQLEIGTKKQIGLTNAISIANNSSLAESLATNNRTLAIDILSKISSDFKENTQFHNVKLHMHTKDIKSFVRAWKPDKYGDDLSSFRHTIIQMRKTQKPFVSFEAGRVGLVLRGLAPIKKEGEYLGSLEFIQGINSVAKAFEKKKMHFLLLMNEALTSIATKAKESQSIGNYRLSQKYVNTEFLQAAKKIDFDALLKNKQLTDGKYYFTFEYVKDFSGKNVGIFLIGEQNSIVYQAVSAAKQIVYGSIINMVIIVIILSIMIYVMLNYSLLSRLSLLHKSIHKVTEEKDLTIKSHLSGNDEISQIGRAFDQMMETFKHLINEIINSGDKLTEESDALAVIAIQCSDSLSEQEIKTTEIAQAIEQIDAAVSDVANNISNTSATAGKTSSKTQEGRNLLQDTISSIQALSSQIETSTEVIHQLNSNSEKINSVVDTIKGIAEQTNLLALNAAIEAARAGEHGRGFAVVADEVRTLAGRTQESTEEINQMIIQLQTDTNQAVAVMNESAERVENVVQQAMKTGSALDIITESIEQINRQSMDIASATTQQSYVLNSINQNIVQINKMVKQSADGSKLVTVSVKQLAELSHNLNKITSKFAI